MKQKKLFYGWWIVVGCVLVAATMVPLVMALANKSLLLITEEMGISRSAFTLSSTITLGLGIFLSPFVSKTLAKGNFKKIQSISIVGFVLAYASISLAQNVYHIYLSAFFLGVFYLNSTMIPISMMITNWFIKKRGLAMSIAFTGISIGGIIFSPLITYWLGEFGWRATYIIMAVIVLLVALPISLFVFKKRPEDMGLNPYGAEESTSAVKKNVQPLDGIGISVQESRKKMFFYLLLIGMFFNGIINNGSLGQFPPALEEMHGSAVQATVISVYSLSGIYGKLIYGWINDKWGIVVSTIFASVSFIFTFVFMLAGSNIMMVYAMALIFGCGNVLGSVTPPLITATIFGQEKYGEVYGIVNSASQVGLSLGSLFVASMFDITGSYNFSWVLLLIFTVLIAACWIAAYLQAKKYSYKNIAMTESEQDFQMADSV